MKLTLFLLALSSLSAWVVQPASPGDLVGKPAPFFNLPRLTAGSVSLADLRGQPAVLVMGTTREAAPATRDWVIHLENHFRGQPVRVLQIAVLDNPWYLPRFATKGMLRDFVPEYGHDLVLLEWGTAVGDAYGLKRDALSHVFLIDREGIVRWYGFDPRTQASYEALLDRIGKL